jgi:hypothetical protein
MDGANNVIGELIEKGQKSTASAASDIGQSVAVQTGIKDEPKAQDGQSNQAETTQSSDPNSSDVVSHFYAPSQEKAAKPQVSSEERLTKVREELSIEQKKHQQMHTSNYYEPLISYEQKLTEEKHQQDKGPQVESRPLGLGELESVKKSENIALHNAQTATEIKGGPVG